MTTFYEHASERFDAGDYSAAFLLYQRAAAAGENVSGCLGLCYHEGLGVTRNRRLARECYQRGVREGDVAAASNLGDLFAEQGDARRANAAYGKAWRMGLDDALINTARLALSRQRRRAARLLAHRLRRAMAANRLVDRDEAIAVVQALIDMTGESRS